MAAIDDLIARIGDEALRERLRAEIERLTRDRKFGLVFEEHLPELTPIHTASMRAGAKVALRTGPLTDPWRVLSVEKGEARCQNIASGEGRRLPVDALVVVREFGDPIFPTLTPVDRVQNGPDDAPWHTLVEAENYHALQLLSYLYAGQVDCIYIDPPYNTGARDWKYNNDYVDGNDRWRHSKWLAMMRRRLGLAKRLLKREGVLIIAIDENEHSHLVCLLEDRFPDSEITSVCVVHNPRGNRGNNFTVTNEYAVYVIKKGIATLARLPIGNAVPRKLRRWGHFSSREERRPSFYPICVKGNKITTIGEMPDDDFHPMGRNVPLPDGTIEIWPIDDDGIERRWNYGRDTIGAHLNRIIVMFRKDGDLDLFITEELSQPKTVWMAPELDAGGKYGSTLVEEIARHKFPYPKSLYSVVRALNNVVRNKSHALILDFFAGSGTTLHAVNLLNALDNGNRRCILVTNNEVSEEEAKKLPAEGHRPGDAAWEEHGICRSVTWPRAKYTLLGRRDDGSALTGEYLTGKTIERERPRRFRHIAFIAPGALDTPARKKQLVSLIDGIPQSAVKGDAAFVVSEKYPASILFDASQAETYLDALEGQDHITDFYIVAAGKAIFNAIRTRITELLAPLTVTEEEKRPMAVGFPANLEYFRLDFLDKDQVELGRRFREILPLLWLGAGAVGPRPALAPPSPDREPIPAMLLPEQNPFAVLTDETRFADFLDRLRDRTRAGQALSHVFLVTDSEASFREMAGQVTAPHVIQLYRDYLENFVINKDREG
uniref:site-specific DNA-methyltransferase (adenine-specific) n=1 Tax=Candidatus Kentrum sp. FM TaxID=2126340 RepID=A0A450W0Y6_9GAMM|nr:MAG: adenine-specific DNA-methyltransferase [Candidatus Kentron sp. FM]VFJ56267.1 MAG: adenine-specific DNA-methyltransferase [Candidatus Kentron sp. FM]VFK10757.1 MAG: adenine-specific DNA-methyltransferase [Candidatus Kentron sp. FM]